MAVSDYIVALQVQPAFTKLVRRRRLLALARRAMAGENVTAPAELSIVIADDETVRELNHRYRGIDAPTDVLSFGMESADAFVTPSDSARHLGDVIISYTTVARQTGGSADAIEGELAHLLVHGLLHLLGYDHEASDEAATMRLREEALLGRAVH